MPKIIFENKNKFVSLDVLKKNKIFTVDNIEDLSNIKIKDLTKSTRIVSWTEITRKSFSLPPVESKKLKKNN